MGLVRTFSLVMMSCATLTFYQPSLEAKKSGRMEQVAKIKAKYSFKKGAKNQQKKEAAAQLGIKTL